MKNVQHCCCCGQQELDLLPARKVLESELNQQTDAPLLKKKQGGRGEGLLWSQMGNYLIKECDEIFDLISLHELTHGAGIITEHYFRHI